jgi:hypothetical protein
MSDYREDSKPKPVNLNPGYATFQLARALTTSEEHPDEPTRARARDKISKWEKVLLNILTGFAEYGSRTPIGGVPTWATLEVVTGGFATGNLLAGGPLLTHEIDLLKDVSSEPVIGDRSRLNTYFLTDEGLARLQDWLQSGQYDVSVPEEGALLVVAWLTANGFTEDARALIETLAPYFGTLRFYPVPLEQPRHFGSRIHLQDVGKTIGDLRSIKPNPRILAHKEAVEVWASHHDRVVALFLETVKEGQPCRHYPSDWSSRAENLLSEYHELRKKHRLCGKVDRPKGYYAQLRGYLSKGARYPDSLDHQAREQIQLILKRYVDKRGNPGSAECTTARRRQLADVAAPTFDVIAATIASRLDGYPKDRGIDDISPLNDAVSHDEANSQLPEGTLIPASIRHKVERCLSETAEILVERGLITSGETLAKVLPQMTSGLRAAGISDPGLRRLYAAVYRAFRRRRSLLLLNLEKQIQIEELPWVAAINRFRNETLSSKELARQALEEITVLTLTSFPHAILPNKLLQELRALAKGADLEIPIVDELAADIFMGSFSGKFVDSVQRAAKTLSGSLYATYYGIDYVEIEEALRQADPINTRWFWQRPAPKSKESDALAELCASRAGVSLGAWDPAINGMIIEQQQILTTQNLAALYVGLDLKDAIRGHLSDMARRCFVWICKRQQVKVDTWHAALIRIKNTAYAWRQMIFYLALLEKSEVDTFLKWAEEVLVQQTQAFQDRFRPALRGLVAAAAGHTHLFWTLSDDVDHTSQVQRFLGWSKQRHWLLADFNPRKSPN